MLKEKELVIRRSFVLIDSLIIIAIFLLVNYLMIADFSFINQFNWFQLESCPTSFVFYIPVLIAIVPVWLLMFYFFGLYRSMRTYSLSNIFFLILKASFLAWLTASSLIFFFALWFNVPTIIISFFIVTTFVLMIEKFAIYFLAHYFRKRGFNFRSILIVGTGKRARNLIEQIQNNSQWGLNIAGIIDKDPNKIGKKILGRKVIGTLDQLESILEEQVIDEVYFVVPRNWLADIQEYINLCEILGKKSVVALDLFESNIAHLKQLDVNDIPLISFETTSVFGWNLIFKRIIDIVISLTAIFILFPLMAMTALIVSITSPGPFLFKQKRVGLNGRLFTMYKFRSMYLDAEKRLKEIQKKNEMTGPVFKMKHDPRISSIGRFIRKTSIDELPQLFNVLKGDMTLVGPRPPLPEEVKKYQTWQRRRLSMKPGITCVWQVSGRNNIDFKQWMELDLYYIDNWSLWFDIKILLKTVPVVLLGYGAH